MRQRSDRERRAMFSKMSSMRITNKGSTVKLAKPSEYRTISPKEGVYLHVIKSKRGVMKANILRRTEERHEKTGKPLSEPISNKQIDSIKKIDKRIEQIKNTKTFKNKIDSPFHDFRDAEIEINQLEVLKKQIKEGTVKEGLKELFPEYF